MELERLAEIISDVEALDGYTITGDTVLSDDLGMDILDVFELLMEIENVLDIEFPQDTISNIRTVGELLEEIDLITGAGEV